METKQVAQGTVGVLALLATMMGTMILTPDQLDNTYYCTITEEVGIFYGGTSGTALTAYPYAENRTNSVRCKLDGINGAWVRLIDYANEENIPLDTFFNREVKIVQTQNTGKQYICSQINCMEVINEA